MLLLLLCCKLYLCSWPSARAQSAPKRRLGVAFATPLQRRRDRWTAIALRRVNRQQHASTVVTRLPGLSKSWRVQPSGQQQLAETTAGGPIARCQVGNSMNNFCSPTTGRCRRYPQQRIHNTFRTLDYAHVTAATRRWSRRSQLSACRCEAQTSSHLT